MYPSYLKKLRSRFSVYALHLLIIGIFCLGFYARSYDLNTHFTHYDDIAMVADIIKTKQPSFKEDLLTALYNQEKPSYNDFQKKLLRKMYETPFTTPLFNLGISLSPALIIPFNSTTAPLQYCMTMFLVHPGQDYRTALLGGRFPSFLASILAIIFLAYFIYKKAPHHKLLVTALGLALISFSWTHIIYAKNSLEYEIGVLASVLMLFNLNYAQALSPDHKKGWAMTGLFCALLGYTHYQIIFLIPAFYLTLVLRNIHPFKQYLSSYMLSGSIFAILMAPVIYILFFVNTSGVGPYTVGLHKEFLFQPTLNNGMATILYTGKFLIVNSYLVITNTLTFIQPQHPLYIFFGILFTSGFGYGLWKLRILDRNLFNYIILSFATYLGLVLLGKLALTPTRQALMYLPLMIIPLCFCVKSPKLIIGYIFIALILFSCSLPPVKTERQDKINAHEFESLFKTYHVDTAVSYAYTLNINIMPNVLKVVNYYDLENVSQCKPWQYKTIALFSTRSELDEYYYTTIMDQLNKDPRIQPKNKHAYKDYRLLYSKVATSNIEFEFNALNSNGANQIFLYILTAK